MLKIGLTGGIGCGKTTVSDMFAAKGVPVLDADQIAHALVEPGRPALEAIVRRFGPGILKSGRLDRARLRQLVFVEPEAKQWLESLLHPLVYAELKRRAERLSAAYCLMVIPLLLETGRRDFVDRLLVVDCPVNLQRQRVSARDGSDEAEIDRILAAQIDRNTRLAVADDVIENTVDLENLADQVNHLHSFYLALSQEQPPTDSDKVNH
jgi:dephospho-CoA kinase